MMAHEDVTVGLLRPNEATFVSILSSCANLDSAAALLVQTGLEAFEAMSREFKIVPKMEHYGCVVDLLGRAGLVREAYEFVGRMPFEADDSVLGALLGACRVHGEIGLGNEVGQRLLNLQPHHCGRYVLLSSIYAGAERWDHAAALRKAMVDAGVDKIPAYSVIH
nr:putative pentatricopeptide repeat-containing protein At1g10330 [Ipomoea batatas]